MSTAGSDSITSSQIRRFGLYRTIDAKTEEFLRLSRKRQIRQGCACAAISTTITVTVVVSIILIYEYSMISESNSRTTFTPKWLNLMNTTVDNLPFEVKLDKAKIGLDPATIKFLPLILKTLKKHKYFDKIIEETTSQNPLEDKIEPTGNNMYDRNIFSDTRNWMRMPTSRLYTIEYKTSPIVYFKNPTRNTDYFTKVRKIRDYQRIMNYVDKMISERVTFGSTVPMNKNIYGQKNVITTDYTTPMTKIVDYSKNTQNENTKKPKITASKDKPHCSCPKRMNNLLTKLINNIQRLLPNLTETPDKSYHVTKPCNRKHTKLITEVPQKPAMESSSKSYSSRTQNIAALTTKPYSTQATTTDLPKVDYTLNAIIALLKPNIQKKNMKNDISFSLKTTTTENYLEGTDEAYRLENTTETMKNISTAKLSYSATTTRDYILSSSSVKTTQTFLAYPKEYEDYAETTPKYSDNKQLNANTNNKQRKIITNLKDQKTNQIEGEIKFSYNNPDIESNNLSNKIMKTDISSTVPTNDIYDNSDILWEFSEKKKLLNTEVIETSTFSGHEMDFRKTSLTNQGVTDNNKIEQTPKPEDITLEEEIEKTSPEDVTAEENLKNLEIIIKTLNNSVIYNRTTTEESEFYEWELIKVEDNYDKNDIFTKSMIPEDKASYLEIQRNDWKQDEHQDYDNNINHYLFE